MVGWENAHVDSASFDQGVLFAARDAVVEADPALRQWRSRIAGTTMDLVTERGLPQNSMEYSKFRDELEGRLSRAIGLEPKALRLGADVAFRSVCESLVSADPGELGPYPTSDDRRQVHTAQRARIALEARDSVTRAESLAVLTTDPWAAPESQQPQQQSQPRQRPSVLAELDALSGNASQSRSNGIDFSR